MALHGVSVGVMSCYNGWLNWCATAVLGLCVVPPSAVHAPTHTHRPSGLLINHAMLTLAVKVWMCGIPAYKPTSKASSSKFSQILSAYTQVYTARVLCTKGYHKHRYVLFTVLLFLSLQPTTGSDRHSVFGSSVNTYFAWCYISVPNGGISMKLGLYIEHVSTHCYKGFQRHSEAKRTFSWGITTDLSLLVRRPSIMYFI